MNWFVTPPDYGDYLPKPLAQDGLMEAGAPFSKKVLCAGCQGWYLWVSIDDYKPAKCPFCVKAERGPNT